VLIPRDLKLATSRFRLSISRRGSFASAAPPRDILENRHLICDSTQSRTWLVSNTTDVESAIASEKGIALDRDGGKLSLGLTGHNAGECGRKCAEDGKKRERLHDCDRKKSERLKED
jgi:hypothetical protein